MFGLQYLKSSKALIWAAKPTKSVTSGWNLKKDHPFRKNLLLFYYQKRGRKQIETNTIKVQFEIAIAAASMRQASCYQNKLSLKQHQHLISKRWKRAKLTHEKAFPIEKCILTRCTNSFVVMNVGIIEKSTGTKFLLTYLLLQSNWHWNISF